MDQKELGQLDQKGPAVKKKLAAGTRTASHAGSRGSLRLKKRRTNRRHRRNGRRYW